MLIRFYVANFLSFAKKTTFSMLAAKNLPSDSHVYGVGEVGILKGAVLYGANASGKSNLIRAIAHGQNLITENRGRDARFRDCRFRLDEEYKDEPTHLEFEIEINGNLYAYGFAYRPDGVDEEWLYTIKGGTDSPIFDRTADGMELNKAVFTESKGRKRLQFMYDDLLPNQLFLTESNRRNIDEIDGSGSLQEVFEWFEEKLQVIFPSTRFAYWQLLEEDEKFRHIMRSFLSGLDTGVQEVVLERNEEDDIPEGVPDEVLERFRAGKSRNMIIRNSEYNHFVLSKEKETISVRELCTKHQSKTGTATFKFGEESDGTKRLTDFIPMFLPRINKGKVFVVDEIDRSLHPELSYQLIDLFMRSENTTESQLVVTTHDVGLMNLDLVRKDEIWFVEKDKFGASELFSLADFKPRKDVNIRNAYLKGRYGGVPLVRGVERLLVETGENIGKNPTIAGTR